VPQQEEALKVRRAVRLFTRKLWPELGDLLDDEGDEPGQRHTSEPLEVAKAQLRGTE